MMAAVLVLSCSTSRPKETVVALPSVPAAPTATASVIATPAPSYVLTLERGMAAWSGAHGNAPSAITAIWGSGHDVFAIGRSVLLHSSDRGINWTATHEVSGNAIWGTSLRDIYAGGTDVKRSTDGGATWMPGANVPGIVMAFGGRDDDVIAVGEGPFMVHSTDHGRSWEPVAHGVTDGTFFDVVTNGAELWVVGLRREPAPSSPLGYHTVPVLMRTSNGGKSFTHVKPPSPGITENEEIRHACFTASGKMFVAMSYSVYVSADRGTTWKRAADVRTEVLALACRGTEVLVGGRNRRFFVSTDDGASFKDDVLNGAFHGPELIALQAAFVSETGDAFVGGEAYVSHEAGTLLRRVR